MVSSNLYGWRKTLLGVLCSTLIYSGAAWSATLTVRQDGSGDFVTIQAAVDAAVSGDVIVIHAGTYTEDVSIGSMSVMPTVKKDGLTIQAAEGGGVTIVAGNTQNRFLALAAAGIVDFGPVDRMGFFVFGNDTTIEGLNILQSSGDVNGMNLNAAMFIASSNVTIRNCEIIGAGKDSPGDSIGFVITPFDMISLSQGQIQKALATNLVVEHCSVHDVPYGLAVANFPGEAGLPVPSPQITVRDSEFYNCDAGLELDGGIVNISDCHFFENNVGLHLSDEITIIQNCLIEDNLEHGIDIDDQELEDNADPSWPDVTVFNCIIRNNGFQQGQYGINLETGSLTLISSVLAGNGDANLFVGTDNRETVAIIDHVDFYQSQLGIGILTTPSPNSVITLNMTNSNIVDDMGIFNQAEAFAEITLLNNNIFASTQIEGMVDVNENMLNVDPQYVDTANFNFHLNPGSPVLTAGVDGTFLGAWGLEGTDITEWMTY